MTWEESARSERVPCEAQLSWAEVWRASRTRMVSALARQFGRELAEDAVQDAYVKCASRPLPSKPGPYFRTAARRCAIDLYRTRTRERAAMLEMAPPTSMHNRTMVADQTEGEIVWRPRRKPHPPELGTIPCPICEDQFKPFMRARIGPKRTCGKPKCVAQLRVRNQRKAAA